MTHPPEPKEPEGLAIGTIVLVAIVSMVIFAGGIYWAEQILERQTAPRQVTTEVGGAEVGIVNQLPFEQDVRAGKLRDRNLEHLASYGWVDAEARRIHVPIDRAVEDFVAEHARGASGEPPR